MSQTVYYSLSVNQVQLSNQWTGQTVGQLVVDLSISSLWVSLPISRLSASLSFAGSVCQSLNQVNNSSINDLVIINGWPVYLSIYFVSQFTDHWSFCWSLVCVSDCQSVNQGTNNKWTSQSELASTFVYLFYESACQSVNQLVDMSVCVKFADSTSGIISLSVSQIRP